MNLFVDVNAIYKATNVGNFGQASQVALHVMNML